MNIHGGRSSSRKAELLQGMRPAGKIADHGCVAIFPEKLFLHYLHYFDGILLLIPIWHLKTVILLAICVDLSDDHVFPVRSILLHLSEHILLISAVFSVLSHA
jgi:hypothetical protein